MNSRFQNYWISIEIQRSRVPILFYLVKVVDIETIETSYTTTLNIAGFNTPGFKGQKGLRGPILFASKRRLMF